MKVSSPLKQFALPILCDMGHAGKSTRKMLNQQCGIGFFLNLLRDPNWQLQSLETIQVWLQEDLAHVEEVLLRPTSVQSLAHVFATSNVASFEKYLETFLKIFKLSHGVALALGNYTQFVGHLVERLQGSERAVARLNLLRICKVVCDVHPNIAAFNEQHKLIEVSTGLSKLQGANPFRLVSEHGGTIALAFP